MDHQIEVVRRRTEYRLRKAQDRAHIVEGLVKALDMIDAIIALIRGAADVDTARPGLMATPFEFTEIQANYILDMQLRRLTQLEGKKLRDELEELRATIEELESILADRSKLLGVIKTSSPSSREKYGDDRRTIITNDTGDIDVTSTSSTTKRSSSSSPTRATSRRWPPTRSGARGAAVAACAGAARTTTTSSTSS